MFDSARGYTYSNLMEKKRRKKSPVSVEAQDNSVFVRVSPRAPRQFAAPPSRPRTPPVARAQNLATAMLEALIGQLADYVQDSHAVEKLIRAQTTRALNELADDPQLAKLIRAQVEQYLAELVAHPEILEPLVRSQMDRYLDHLRNDPARLQNLQARIGEGEPTRKPEKPRPNKKTIDLE